ncbi:hypothetical protein M902_1109 [Bacteriovorax sp. BAL6_X]|uniref:hypothetical protein n=1 Tax=Bacteriovorax sp. BAL6_X TaxID=1201290 RepID=UPI00038680C8|nr:hypothetical protein [Bacteriovorax sp. BAL6_X]EPZ49339.1 hypothetical protein M902_1109 [Bacteriovorax sp. BAL6_X]
MKFSCEFNDIEYFFTTEIGPDTNDKYHLFLSGPKLTKYQNDEMKFHTLTISAKYQGTELNYFITGIPLSLDEEEQTQELEDFFEAKEIFEKIEDAFELLLSDRQAPPWGLKEYK